MVAALLERPDLLALHGITLYWSAWTALQHARQRGVVWTELKKLGESLRQLARIGPRSVQSLRSAKLARLLGTRLALSLQPDARD
jgi:hypothetical protein